jgi:uncharacterized protein YjiS (DUF1127 family)
MTLHCSNPQETTMPSIDIQRPQGRGLLELLAPILHGIGEARRRRAVYARTRDELLALSDRDLADLGIERSRVPEIARRAAGAA